MDKSAITGCASCSKSRYFILIASVCEPASNTMVSLLVKLAST